MQPLLQGVLFGLLVAVSLGPAFFSLLQTSVSRGFKAGFFMAVGIALSDISIIALSYMGISKLISNPENQLIVGIIGGIILAIFGLVTFTKRPAKQINDNMADNSIKPSKSLNPLAFTIKGYFLNIANPFLIIFWMGIMSYVSANYGLESKTVISFFSGTIMTIFGTDIIKSFVGNKIKKYLKPKVLIWFNRIVGIILMASAVILISRVLYDLYAV
ncbi:MAG: LysE family transporter [Bacteroidales bacterium]|nr:LysE family transporter [Bacteroidales bacterium]